MSIRLYCIVGNGGAGKSTVARYLVMPKSYQENKITYWNSVLLESGGYLRVFTRLRSFQEASIDLEKAQKLLQQQLKAVATTPAHGPAGETSNYPVSIKPKRLNALITLRLDAYNELPPAFKYLDKFVKLGWSPHRIAVLPTEAESAQPNYDKFLEKAAEYERYGAPVSYGDAWDSSADVPNWKIGRVRRLFGWA
jgi:ABC-type cobalamin/Fe3+-siderophores transport system ATPase subunit